MTKIKNSLTFGAGITITFVESEMKAVLVERKKKLKKIKLEFKLLLIAKKNVERMM